MGRACERKGTISFVLWQERRGGRRGLIVFLPVSEPAAGVRGAASHIGAEPECSPALSWQARPVCPSGDPVWRVLKWGGPFHCLSSPRIRAGGVLSDFSGPETPWWQRTYAACPSKPERVELGQSAGVCLWVRSPWGAGGAGSWGALVPFLLLVWLCTCVFPLGRSAASSQSSTALAPQQYAWMCRCICICVHMCVHICI